MTKKQLIKWLEDKRALTLEQIEKEYGEALSEHRKALRAELGIYELAEQIKPLLVEADTLILNWKEKWKERVEMNSYSCSLHRRLYDFTKDENALLAYLCRNEFDDTTKERQQLNKKKRDLMDKAEQSYSNVILNVQSYKTAILGLEYLKELGFDMTEVDTMEQAPVTTLTVPVDTRFLFLGKKEDSPGAGTPGEPSN